MTGLRCPNCGFYNLSARSKCARCGKPLPDAVEHAKAQDLFDENSESGAGSESIPLEPAAAAQTPSQVEIESVSVSTEPPAPPAQPECEPGTGSVSMPKKVAAPGPKPEAAPAEDSGTMPKSPTSSGSLITGVVVETKDLSQVKKKDTEPSEAGPEPAEAEPLPRRIIPEVPSFDDSAVSKVGTEAELGELSEFFKDAKKKPPAPAGPVKPTTHRTPMPAREKKPVSFMDDVSSGGVEPSAGVEPAAPEVSAPEDESMSQIKIKSRDVSHPSEFNPNFSQPVFPEFGAGSAALERADKSESDSAVSRPFEAPIYKVILGGIADGVVYLLIIAAFLSAGALASGARLDLPAVLNSFSAPILVAILVVVWFYQVFFISILGQTPGQMVAGIEVLDKSGHRISIPKASVRAMVYILCLLPCGLGFILSLLGNSLPDKAANTKPVRW